MQFTFLCICNHALIFILICFVIADIARAPSNLTVPLGQSSPAVFQCSGLYLEWLIDEEIVWPEDEPSYEERGFVFRTDETDMMTFKTLMIPVKVENNSTQLRCSTVRYTINVTSELAKLTIAGTTYTLEPLNKGHFGSMAFVLYWEAVLCMVGGSNHYCI